MSEAGERIVPAFQLYADASSKFNYFVTGGAGAVLAYSIERFDPTTGLFGTFLVPVAWGFLIISLAAGLSQLETTVELAKVNVKTMEAEHGRTQIRQILSQPTAAGVEMTGRGVQLSRSHAAEIALVYDDAIAQANKLVASLQSRGLWAYRIRNVGLLAGFGTLAFWKALNLFLSGP